MYSSIARTLLTDSRETNHTLARGDADQPASSQLLQSFPHRSARDIEAGGERALVEGRTRPEFSAFDLVLKGCADIGGPAAARV